MLTHTLTSTDPHTLTSLGYSPSLIPRANSDKHFSSLLSVPVGCWRCFVRVCRNYVSGRHIFPTTFGRIRSKRKTIHASPHTMVVLWCWRGGPQTHPKNQPPRFAAYVPICLVYKYARVYVVCADNFWLASVRTAAGTVTFRLCHILRRSQTSPPPIHCNKCRKHHVRMRPFVNYVCAHTDKI